LRRAGADPMNIKKIAINVDRIEENAIYCIEDFGVVRD
jgi:hypothetical protein